MFTKPFAFACWFSVVTSTRGFDLVREYSGASFFDSWTYYGKYDNLTLGNVNWVDRDTATTNGLTYISDHNTAIIRVDNFTTVPFNETRNSVRITSNDFYDLGSLWVFDAIHLPFGCSVWPAWWTKGLNWPEDGEIDIIENINLAQKNQMALHTTPGCFQTSAPNQTGTSCSPGSGCVVGDPDPRSWGQNFADAGGGVWATQFDVQGIFIWFWSRADVPDTLSASAPSTPLDISAWGTPTASYLAATCNISEFFTPQQLLLDITLCASFATCGDWAGVPSIYMSTCASQTPNDPTNPVSSQNPRTPSCYADNVVGPGARYDDAYFEINHIRAYTTAATPVQPSAATATTSSSSDPNAGATLPGNNAPAPNVGTPERLASMTVAWAVSTILISVAVLLI